MASEWQSSQQSAADLDVIGEHNSSTLTLDFSESADLHVLHSSPPESGRFADVINNFISRGLEQQPRTGEGVGSAVRYFQDVAVAMEGRHKFSPEQAAKVHDLMINGWQKHVAEVVGRTLRSSDRLRAVLDDIIEEAELSTTIDSPAIEKLALHNALASIDGFVPPTPHSQAEPDLKPQPSQASKLDQHDADGNDNPRPGPSHDGRHEQQGLQRGDALKPHPSRLKNFEQPSTETAVDDAKATEVVSLPTAAASPQQNAGEAAPTKPRFSSTSKFFKHHAVKAKKAARTGAWSSEDRDRAKQAADGEWSRMDMRTQSEWEDLFRQWQQGAEAHAEPKATAHLFKDGVAVSPWSSTATSSPSAEARPSKRRKTTASSATAVADKTDPVPTRPAPHCDPFRGMFEPEHLNFVASLCGDFHSSSGIAKGCHASLVHTHGERYDRASTEKRLLSKNVFIIRWRDAKTARAFVGNAVKISGTHPKAQAYPTSAPQIFVTHMNHLGPKGIRKDDVLPAILAAADNNPVHLRHEKILASTDTIWIAVFKAPPQLLRFTVGVQDKSGEYQVVPFEPLMAKARCAVCNEGHTAVECDQLLKANRDELGVKKGDENYLVKMPELV